MLSLCLGQRVEDGTLVTALQQAARFYLLAGLRSVQLLDGVKTQQDWSDKLNDEQLASALSQLQALYGLHELAGFDHEDVPELKDAGSLWRTTCCCMRTSRKTWRGCCSSCRPSCGSCR